MKPKKTRINANIWEVNKANSNGIGKTIHKALSSLSRFYATFGRHCKL